MTIGHFPQKLDRQAYVTISDINKAASKSNAIQVDRWGHLFNLLNLYPKNEKLNQGDDRLLWRDTVQEENYNISDALLVFVMKNWEAIGYRKFHFNNNDERFYEIVERARNTGSISEEEIDNIIEEFTTQAAAKPQPKKKLAIIATPTPTLTPTTITSTDNSIINSEILALKTDVFKLQNEVAVLKGALSAMSQQQIAQQIIAPQLFAQAPNVQQQVQNEDYH